ncbi:hypothetical protein BaRGS_00036383 [Batillaria attramentaria]|uniref:VTT domain-containing protein n=1 Tax=Batillaria attramentaria TaxID=370345 RepID=A0ABD0JC19_9CAEN
MTGCVSVGPALLIGEPSKMDEIFLPSSLSPSSLAEELREEIEMDVNPCDDDNRKHFLENHPPEEQSSDGTTRIIVDALVTTPSATTRWYQATLTSVLLIIVIILCLTFGHRYIRTVLLWLQEADFFVGIFIFTVLFFIVSFPLFWGYALLLVAAGYLYGCVFGPLVVIGCGFFGLSAANAVMRNCCRTYFMERFYSTKVEAVVRLMNGASGFKVVALSRVTPIPFGLQNALFSLSDMGQIRYLVASLVGLIPMAVLYCYVGSTLRSMEDVLSDHDNQFTGYLILGGQILFTAVLLVFVVRKARLELKKTVEQTSNSSGKSTMSCALDSGV